VRAERYARRLQCRERRLSAQNVSANPGAKGGTHPLRASPTDHGPAERYQLQWVVRSSCDLEKSDGRLRRSLEFSGVGGGRTSPFRRRDGFSGHDNGHMDAVKTASIVAPVTAQIK
jgi:hypothetical protein